MRLSHRRKRASKHGRYWPARTQQARSRAQSIQFQAFFAVRASAEIHSMLARFNAALAEMCRGAATAAEKLRTWLLPRDASQSGASQPHAGTGKIVIHLPQKD